MGEALQIRKVKSVVARKADLRLVNHHGHARLAMVALGAVDPDRLGVIDSNGEYISLDIIILEIGIVEGQKYAYTFAGSRLEAGEDSERARGNTTVRFIRIFKTIVLL